MGAVSQFQVPAGESRSGGGRKERPSAAMLACTLTVVDQNTGETCASP